MLDYQLQKGLLEKMPCVIISALVSIHAPFCYFIGITVMEFVKSSEKKTNKNIIVILKAMFSNALVVGIILGFFVNVIGIN